MSQWGFGSQKWFCPRGFCTKAQTTTCSACYVNEGPETIFCGQTHMPGTTSDSNHFLRGWKNSDKSFNLELQPRVPLGAVPTLSTIGMLLFSKLAQDVSRSVRSISDPIKCLEMMLTCTMVRNISVECLTLSSQLFVMLGLTCLRRACQTQKGRKLRSFVRNHLWSNKILMFQCTGSPPAIRYRHPSSIYILVVGLECRPLQTKPHGKPSSVKQNGATRNFETKPIQ